MTKKPRGKTQKAIDMVLIRHLSSLGWSMNKIHSHPDLKDHIGLTTIKNDVKEVLAEWKNDTPLDLDIYKIQTLQILNYAISESSQAWEKSKADKVKKTLKTKGLGSANSQSDVPLDKETGVQTENAFGNPNYLKRLLDSVEKRNKLLGLYPDIKHKHTGKIAVQPITGMRVT